MLNQYFENLTTSLESRLAVSAGQPIARKRFTLEIAQLGSRLFSGEHNVAWCGVMAPFDLLNAMGVTSCFVEFVGAMLSSTGTVGPMLELAEEEGYGTDGCSYHRSVMGATLQGLMPAPDFLVATTAPCVAGAAVLENLARHFERDLFVLPIPPTNGEREVAFLAERIEALANFVGDHTGRPLDRERLSHAVDLGNQTRALLIETFDLAKNVPTPARRRDLVNFGVVSALFGGTDAGLQIAQTYRDEFADRVARGVGGARDERVRLMWLQNRIQFKHPLEKILEEELGCAVVVDELNDINFDPIDPNDPFTGMARRCLSVPLVSQAKRRVELLQRQAREYRVDGAINPCHWGCRQGTGIRGLVDRGLEDVGVPVLNLEVDCVDPRSFAEGQLRTRLEAFVEMIENNPRRWS